jgi:hypothetical protein
MGVGPKAAKGYPMSHLVEKEGVELNQSALRLASSSSGDRIASGLGGDSCYHANFCRAAFQVLWKTRINAEGEYDDRPTLKRANKFDSFAGYVRSGMESQGVPDTSITDEDIMSVHDRLMGDFRKLRCYAALRQSLAPLLESLLILDRVTFLLESFECGGIVAAPVPLFDPSISPRSVAIVAHKTC